MSDDHDHDPSSDPLDKLDKIPEPDPDEREFTIGESIEIWEGLADNIMELADSIREERSKGIEYGIEQRVYEDALLDTPKESIELSQAYYWSETIDGEYNIDIPDEEIPEGVDLEECRLSIFSEGGIPLLAGEIETVGAVDGLGGNTTVVISQEIGQ
jgi:hypothetical protein